MTTHYILNRSPKICQKPASNQQSLQSKRFIESRIAAKIVLHK